MRNFGFILASYGGSYLQRIYESSPLLQNGTYEYFLRVNLINPWLVGEECKPIITRADGKGIHFVFPRTFTRRLSVWLAQLRGGLPLSSRGLIT
jgi:hypothetical protein